MPLSLHAVTVLTWRQMLGSLLRLLDKAQTHCAERGLAPETLLLARLRPDMEPFAYQVKSAVVHSVGAIDGVRVGLFRPDVSAPPASFAALRERLNWGIAQLDRYETEEIEALQGGDVCFVIGDAHVDFVAEDFLLSFSMPNFFFHVTTAYDIMRNQGVAIGKRDYLGRWRKKPG